jgi:hypothetical protein
MGWPEKSSNKKFKPKKTYVEIAGKFIENLSKDEANEGQAIGEKRLNTEKILQEEEEMNIKLKATLEKLMRIREENAKLKQQQPHGKSTRPSTTKFHNKLYRLR